MRKKQLKEAEERAECEHEWKALGTEKGEVLLELMWAKCGQKKEIYLFP